MDVCRLRGEQSHELCGLVTSGRLTASYYQTVLAKHGVSEFPRNHVAHPRAPSTAPCGRGLVCALSGKHATMIRRFLLLLVLLSFGALLAAAGIGFAYLQQWDGIVSERFRTHTWAFPTKIFADSAMVFPGLDLEAVGFVERLTNLGYQSVPQIERQGDYHWQKGAPQLDVLLHNNPAASNESAGHHVRLQLDRGVVTRIEDVDSGKELFTLELEPGLIGGMFAGTWEERRLVTLADVSPRLLQAIISVEDRHFYQHRGIDVSGIARALLSNLRRGQVVQGGSTLTQQLMKNFFLSDERSLRRKVREAAMALIVEYRFSKEEILENYLNEIYLGQRGTQAVHGVWEASRLYFSKDPKDLSIAESATLAGMIRAPNRLSPLRNPQQCKERRDYALRLLLEQEQITAEEFAAAIEEPIRTVPGSLASAEASYFVDVVRQELTQTYPADVLTSEGLHVYTSLDTRLQGLAEQVLHDGIAELERKHAWLRSDNPDEQLQACLIAVQPQTGAIKAMMGGRGYKSTQFNRCTQALRQPGSVFKPFTYLAAFEATRAGTLEILPTSVLLDEPFEWTYPGGKWSPSNYGNFLGEVSVREALEQSLNAATARLANLVGLPPILDLAQRMGISSPLPAYPSAILGAVEVSPFEVAQAFGVLANGGLRARLVSIKSVTNRAGEVIERNPIQVEQVIDPDSAYLVTHLMEGVLDHGTAGRARSLGFKRPASGKTGTTNDYNDAWFVGFTPDLLTVVWVGFDRKRSLRLAGGQAALPMWTEFMKKALQGWPANGFQPPPGVTLVSIDPLSGQLATENCPAPMQEAFFVDHVPTDTCPLHPVRTREAEGIDELVAP